MFAVREFRPLFGSTVLATVGDQLARLALTVLVYERTSSAVYSAATFAVSYLPWLLAGPVLAALADRFPRRQVMVVSDVVRAVLVAGMAVPGAPLPVLLALLLLVAVCAPAYEAARAALTADVLSDDRYAVATSLSVIVQQLSQVVAFLVGGLLVTALSPTAGLLANAATFALSGGWLAIGLRRRPAPQAEVGEPAHSVWTDVLVGLRLVGGRPQLRAIIGVLWVGVLLTNAHEGMGPALSADLVGSQAVVGVVLAAHPIGATLGGVVVGRMCPPALRERLIVPLVLGSVTALALAGVCARVLGGAAATAGFLALLVVSGFCSAWAIPLNVAFVQAVPAAMRGRAFGVAIAGMSGVQGVGALLAGAAVGTFTATTVVLGIGLVGLPLIAGPLIALVRTRPPTDAGTARPSGA